MAKRKLVSSPDPNRDAPIAILDWPEADRVLGGVAAARATFARVQADADAVIEALKARAKADVAHCAEGIDAGLAALEAFTRAHEADLEGRSMRLTHGVVGLRKSTKIVLKRTLRFVLNALVARGLAHCIRTKVEVDKEALEPCEDSLLAEVGCQRKTSDLFFADTDEVAL